MHYAGDYACASILRLRYIQRRSQFFDKLNVLFQFGDTVLQAFIGDAELIVLGA